jgi:hypothetical protein
MRWYGWTGLALIGVVGFAGYTFYGRMNAPLVATGEEAVAALQAEVEAQNEEAFSRPARKALEVQEADPLKNVYFGDLHIHTALSFDSHLFGNQLGLDAAYRIAKGETALLGTGERVELTRPLDFAALADHAEGFGLHEACDWAAQSEEGKAVCEEYDHPSIATFLKLRADGVKRPMSKDLTIYGDDEAIARKFAAATWAKIRAAADLHNEPGRFTAFAAYEYSPVLEDTGKHHRNIIFRGSETPTHAVSAYDAASEIDLWKQLEAGCKAPCEFLTIPHNPNKSWGLAFASHTIDGIPYTDEDWKLRRRSEPIVEMFQIKGNSECSSAFGATDEECDFEQFFPKCEDGDETLCITPSSMVRDGLHKGLALEDAIGVNPLAFGLIGSTDTHNSNPGDTEEWDFRGASAFVSSPASKRLATGRGGSRNAVQRNPGGLAAIWAEENTRGSLFDAMVSKEVYATSGTRIRLRMFGGFNWPEGAAEDIDVAAAYGSGVPMGGTLKASAGAFGILVRAVSDPDNALLNKVQIIKGWVEDGERHEVVHDIACSGGVNGQTGKCEDNGARVNISDCSVNDGDGSKEIKVLWRDDDYDAAEDAFYYVRVVQNPTCRWSTYDSLRLGLEPPSDVPATITEMAWSSPIWVKSQ